MESRAAKRVRRGGQGQAAGGAVDQGAGDTATQEEAVAWLQEEKWGHRSLAEGAHLSAGEERAPRKNMTRPPPHCSCGWMDNVLPP